MNRHIAEVTGIVSSYGYSALTYANDINWLGIITALAGASLTFLLALKVYREAEGVRLDNQLKRNKLKEQ